MTMMQSVRKVVDPVLPPEQRLRPGALEQMTSRARSKVHDMAGDTSTVQMLFDYRKASDDDLKAYVAFYESDDGRWFSNLVSKSLIGAVRSLADKAAAEVAKAVQPPSGRAGAAPKSN